MTEARKKRSERKHGGMTGGIILTGIGTLFLLHNFDVLDFDHAWPLILIVIGVALILKQPRHKEPAQGTPTPGT